MKYLHNYSRETRRQPMEFRPTHSDTL